jgi:hypothetical protein
MKLYIYYDLNKTLAINMIINSIFYYIINNYILKHYKNYHYNNKIYLFNVLK